ncbi:MAG TPA: hypothetical protein VIY54_11240 [Steroidobacteraceae bacterium]
MPTPAALVALTGIFILGMIWLRTRMQYPREVGRLRLQRAGWIYFGGVLLVLATGWVAAPPVGRLLTPGAASTATLMREIWFLATYYLFILVHRIVKSRGTSIFRARPR